MRLADPSDLQRLEFLENELFPDNSLNARSLLGELSAGKCWVVERQRKIVGYTLVRVVGELVDILRVGVLPTHQGQGIGRELVKKAMAEAPTAMLSVRKVNTGAIRLYQSLGFHVTGELMNGLAPSWVMRATSGACRRRARSGRR